jgi:hypothetical protein
MVKMGMALETILNTMIYGFFSLKKDLISKGTSSTL